MVKVLFYALELILIVHSLHYLILFISYVNFYYYLSTLKLNMLSLIIYELLVIYFHL